MKCFLSILVFVASSFIARAQELPENWHTKADTAYVGKDSVIISIAKDEARDSIISKRFAIIRADAQALKLAKVKKMDVSSEIIEEKNFLNQSSGIYSYYVAKKYIVYKGGRPLK